MRITKFFVTVILLSIIASVSMPVMASQGISDMRFFNRMMVGQHFQQGQPEVHRQYLLRFILSPTGRN